MAVFLFWLKTGLDQNNISTIFSINTQQDVSRLLQQVRAALLKDFVPKYLGVNWLDRNGWLAQNTYIAKELCNIDDNQLVLIADGTYCYCQKSLNNYFQRKSFSMQKSRHLVKPFVICAPNGKIVDIYGLFEATKNDATILTDILSNEKDLTTLLQPNDVFLLDRGFRDCVEHLKNTYNINSQMPSLQQKSTNNNNKQLSALEANQTRFVTKCRWVIEVVNSFLKKSFKALKEVPNNTLTHTLDDFRIAGALINRFFKSLFSDQDNFIRIVKLMKERVNNENDLKSLVETLKLNRKSQFESINASTIDDFPKLSIEEIKTNITLGSYQLKQAVSYIAEHINKGNYEIRVNKETVCIDSSKIIYSIIQSRHSNKTKYRVYIKYKPEKRTIESIESWYCTCKNGCRTVGCCSHIASVILFLSNLVYQNKIVKPAEKLISIFPYYKHLSSCTSSSGDEPKKNKKKSKKKPVYGSDTSIIEDDLDETFSRLLSVASNPYDNTQSQSKITKPNNENEKSSKNKAQKKPLISSDANELDDENLNESFKRLLSVTDNENHFKKKKDKSATLEIDGFYLPVPKWGGVLVDENNNSLQIEITNTCTIDYLLLALWTATKLSNKPIIFLNETVFREKANCILNIIQNIESNNWNMAKSIWIQKIIKKSIETNSISLFGSEYEFFITHIKEFQNYELTFECSSICQNNQRSRWHSDLFFEKINKDVCLSINKTEACIKCFNVIRLRFKFLNINPGFIIVQTKIGADQLYKADIPLNLTINNINYKLLCGTMFEKAHFKAFFYLNNSYYIIDDLNIRKSKRIPKIKIITCFYYLE